MYSSDPARKPLDFVFTSGKYTPLDTKSTYSISLKAIDDHHIQTSLYKDGSLLKMDVTKGTVDDGYFTFAINKIIQSYGLVNILGNKSTRIGQSKTGDLLVDYRHSQITAFTVIPLKIKRNKGYALLFRRQNAAGNGAQ